MSAESRLFSKGDEKTLLMVVDWLEVQALSYGGAGKIQSVEDFASAMKLWDLVGDIREKLALRRETTDGSRDRNQDDH